MTPEQILRLKLRKIEALFAGAATPGEKAAAGAAAERIRERLGKTSGTEKSVELKFSISDVWSRQLFIALCRRYGLRPFRHRRMHRQSILIKAPQSFMEQVLWPEFQELNAALIAYLSEITQARFAKWLRRRISPIFGRLRCGRGCRPTEPRKHLVRRLRYAMGLAFPTPKPMIQRST